MVSHEMLMGLCCNSLVARLPSSAETAATAAARTASEIAVELHSDVIGQCSIPGW